MLTVLATTPIFVMCLTSQLDYATFVLSFKLLPTHSHCTHLKKLNTFSTDQMPCGQKSFGFILGAPKLSSRSTLSILIIALNIFITSSKCNLNHFLQLKLLKLNQANWRLNLNFDFRFSVMPNNFGLFERSKSAQK